MKTTRNTNSKAVIFDLITQSEVALSHIEIQNRVNGLCDRVTIYRILERLINEDLIHKAVGLDGTVKYAGCNHGHHKHIHNHVHFSCTKCKSIKCLEGIEPQFSLPDNYQVAEVNFTVTGLCPNCI